MSLFYTALSAARNSPKQPTEDMPIPEYLAQISVSVEKAEERYDMGIKRLQGWLKEEPSTDDLSANLICFSDFFSYIY